MRVMELHAPLRIVQRAKGRTATAAAAYRAAERIDCQRTGQVHDYTKKRGVEATEIHTAEDAPDWARQRSALWNAAEMREKHPRAQTARELEIGFPHEFSEQQRREAGRGVAKLLVSRYGSAADVAWHFPNRKGDQRNFHAHILFTNRAITADGWAKTKRNALDERDTGPDEVKSLRAAVANVINQIAARDRLQVYVEHLSFEDRGLDREATQHLGPNATEIERRGEASDIGDRNRAIEAANARREALQEENDNLIDFALARQKRDRKRPWEVFYSETQGRRRLLSESLDRQFAAQQAEASAELQGLQQQQADRGFVQRLWHRVTGRKKDEDLRGDMLASTLRIIEQKKREAWESFERDRVQRLEGMKADMANADSEDQSRFAEFLRAQEAAAGPPQSGTTTDSFGNAVFDDWTHDDHTIGLEADALGQAPPAAEESDPLVDQMKQRLDASRKRGRSM
jgi:hypothetical protein